MNGELAILAKIRYKPLLYLGEKNLQKLFIFLDGFLACEQLNNPEYISPLICFNDFVAYKYHNNRDSLYSVIRQQTQSEDMAFDLFFDILDEYLLLEPYKKNKFYFDAVNMLYNIKSIIPLKNYFDCNVEVYPDYADFPQFVNAYYKNNAENDWAKLILGKTESVLLANNKFEQLLEMYLKNNRDGQSGDGFVIDD